VVEAVIFLVETQERTVDETLSNIREALPLHIEGEDTEELGFYLVAPAMITMEMAPVYAKTSMSIVISL
jgi:hypothetical protein